MNPVDIIACKRDGRALARKQIAWFVAAYSRGEVPEYQMSALAMAIYLNGMDDSETAALTEEMLASGTTLTWSSPKPKVDKHSTGGIGDKVSIVLAPLLACCGFHVPMISGRGLGPTGGTLDKLEAIPGFRTNLSTAEIQRITEQVGCVITGATADIAPADKRLYALRDVTGTVASIPLITASIMSKKLAEGLDCLVLDVKCGSGAFMKTIDAARALARSLVNTGARMGVATSALITDMNQPLGRMIGNAVEVDESIATLTGNGPDDLCELTLQLAAEALVASGRAASTDDALAIAGEALASGRAWQKFQEMVSAQGGDLDAARPVTPASDVMAERAGCVASIDTERLGHIIIELGGGRRIAADKIDHAVGLEMLFRLGDRVVNGQPLVRVFAEPSAAARVTPAVRAAIVIGDEAARGGPLIIERISPASGGRS